MKIVSKWTSSGKTFKIGDYVIYSGIVTFPSQTRGFITSIEVCDAGDGHVIIDDNPNTLTDFCYIDFDKSYYREQKLNDLGI